MMGFSNEEKLTELKRELRMRKSVYRAMVEDDRMSAQLAARRIEIMEQIVDDYEKLAVSERLI